MNSTRQWILFSLLRVGVFALAMIVLVMLGARPWLAAVIAAIIGLCVSYLFLSRQRAAVAASIEEFRRSKHVDVDAEAENDALGDDRPDAAGSEDGAGSEGERGAETDTEHERRETGQL